MTMRKGTIRDKLSNRDIGAQRSEYDFLSNLFFLYTMKIQSFLYTDMFGLIYKRSEVS